jgi:hypothetical protein
MINPFKPGDKVLIQRKGIEIEAVVRSTWNHEVQVRIADGELLWRTVKTARLIQAAEPASSTPGAPLEPDAAQVPPEETSLPEAVEEVAEAPASVESAEPAPAPEAPAPEEQPAESPISKKARKRDRGILGRMLTKGPFMF